MGDDGGEPELRPVEVSGTDWESVLVAWLEELAVLAETESKRHAGEPRHLVKA